MALFLLGWVNGTQKQKLPGVDDHRLRIALKGQDLALTGISSYPLVRMGMRSGEATVDGSAELPA